MYRNPDFIKRVTSLELLNLMTQDFTGEKGLNYKTDIQSLFSKYYFKNTINFKEIALNNVDKDKVNILINQIKAANLSSFNYIYKYPIPSNRFGPGEIVLYLLLTNASLGGITVGVDLVDGNNSYEIKAVRVLRNLYCKNFNVGSKIPNESELIVELSTLCKERGIQGNSTTINTKEIKLLRKRNIPEFESIQSRYANIVASDYFKNETIFINNNDTNDKGLIVSIKRPTSKDILIDRVSEGRIRPMIDLR